MWAKHYIIYFPLRLGQLIFAATVGGIAATATLDANFVYTIVVAGLSVGFALFWLCSFKKMWTHFLTDAVLFIGWIVAFSVLVQYIDPMGCGSVWAWGDIMKGGTCSRWKAAVAFSFLSLSFWLLTALTGVVFLYGYNDDRPALSGFWRSRTLPHEPAYTEEPVVDNQAFEPQ